MSANADPEFAPLDEIFGDVSFNFCAQDEHVPEIERFCPHGQGPCQKRLQLSTF